MRRSLWLCGLLLAAPLMAQREATGSGVQAQAKDLRSLDRWVEDFNDPVRNAWQKPPVVLDMLGVEQGMKVAILGAGTGLFVAFFGAAVGERGKVFAVDTEQGFLDQLRTRVEINQSVVEPVLATPEDPRLPKGELDVAISVNTWHLVSNRTTYLLRLKDALRPDGRLAVIDFRQGDIPVGPPPTRRLSREKVIAELEKAGWTLAAESVALPYQYFLVFYPPGSAPASS